MPITTPTTAEIMAQLQCCVIIPTYNNAQTLKRVIDGVLAYTSNVLVVNDGSTDNTSMILEGYPEIPQIHLQKNKGKGNALRLGFKRAVKLGYAFSLTIDSDGQHFPADIPVFLNALNNEPSRKVLLIGARNMGHETVPKNSSFGNRFSNFWFWVETGKWLQDTQCGFRLYPLEALKDLSFYTPKFEFEIEVIVRAAWNGINVKNVPVKVLYDTSERVTHFRPIIDFARISILNTWLVLVAFFYIKPRNLFRKLKKKGIKRFFYEDFLHNQDSPRKKALSIALGVLIGLSPLWGFQTIIVLFLAILFKLNKVIAFAFSNISFPPFIPFVLYASTKVGQFVLGEPHAYTIDEMANNFEVFKHLKTYIIGSLVLSFTAATAIGFLGYIFLSVFDRKRIAINNG